MFAMVEYEKGDGTDDGEWDAGQGRGGYAIAVVDESSADGCGHRIGYVEGDLDAGAPKHFATFGISHDKIL